MRERPRGVSIGLRSSVLSVVLRESMRLVFTAVLARLLGPLPFGIVAQATVYIAVMTIVLDQGLASALIQKEVLGPKLVRAVTSLNLLLGLLLGFTTFVIAPLWSDLFKTPELVSVLGVLGAALLLKAAAITPRAMLSRGMRFSEVARADVYSAVAGGVIGIVAATVGLSYWALVVQSVATDLILLVLLSCAFGFCLPSFDLRPVKTVMSYSTRSFAANFINTIGRNVANGLVGLLGAQSLAYYALGNRVLMLPVQLAGRSIATVLLSSFSRRGNDGYAVGQDVTRVTRVLAIFMIPMMGLLAVSSPQLVLFVFGSRWSPAAPIISVLALVGACQGTYTASPSALLSLGRADVHLRYCWLTNGVSIVGIVIGLRFGLFWVAVGYAVAACLVLPPLWFLQRRYLGISILTQFRTVGAAVHVTAWMAGSYILVTELPLAKGVDLVVGLGTSVLVGVVILRLLHQATLRATVLEIKQVLRG
jgi:O-antigen/teichoic acid export membrane protein